MSNLTDMIESLSQAAASDGIHMVAEVGGDIDQLFTLGKGGEMPVLTARNLVPFPAVPASITIGRKSSLKLVKYIQAHPRKQFAIFCQNDDNVEEPTLDDLYPVGVICQFIQLMDMPGNDDKKMLLTQPLVRCSIESIVKHQPYMTAVVEAIPEDELKEDDVEFETVMGQLRKKAYELIEKSDENAFELKMALNTAPDDRFFINQLAFRIPMKNVTERMKLLDVSDYKQRAMMVLENVNELIEYANVRIKIHNLTQRSIDRDQRNYFLREEIKSINRELGSQAPRTPEVEEICEKAALLTWPEAIEEKFNKELSRLEQISPQSSDYNTQLSYLQQVVDLPWEKYTKDNLDLKRAQRILDRDHYGMEKVKQRILEHIAVIALRGNLRAPILCLYGPPGVGKTSLGKSIADALNRKYVRMSLGGLHDEAEIRGHRRTYIGAMVGRIIKNIEKAGTGNPVFILDEIDKVTQSTHNGDPSSALLEVLDPEQNSAFHDNFLDMDYDLSKVMFIATANDLSTIPGPLRDRMEIIEVSGYTTEEKVEIARRHLLPREKEKTGIDNAPMAITVNRPALETIIEKYTRESGVRQLEKQVNKLLRKLAFQLQLNGTIETPKIGKNDIEGLLGKAPFYRDIYQGNDYAGVVTGLAWTSVGGEILFIETSLSQGKAGKLTLTGNLGDVMKESAVIALEYVKAHAADLGIDPRVFEHWNIHIHVPEGATPKDGPSAGISIATSIASALTQRKVRKNVAMTGEITLRGKVLPVGGIKEKILAAKRAGITDILLCSANRKDIEDIAPEYLNGVTFHYVENVNDVWDFALTNELVKNPLKLIVPEDDKKKAATA